jgi:hypothetical protein
LISPSHYVSIGISTEDSIIALGQNHVIYSGYYTF